MKKHLLLLLCVLSSAVACNKEQDTQPLRPEYIKVYETTDGGKLLSDIQVPFEGKKDGQFHVYSNVPLQSKYQVSPNATVADWFTIKTIEEVEPGHTVVTYDAESLVELNTLDRRSGSLSFSCPDRSLGKFLTVRQGYELTFTDDFSDVEDGVVVLTGKQTYTTKEYSILATDYFDYISFNVWATSENEYPTRNITLDVTVQGGMFYNTGRTTYRVNVPLGTGPDKNNLRYLLISGTDGRMSAKTNFTFSVDNDNLVYVHIDNLMGYKVAEAELGDVIEDEEFYEQEEEWI